MSTVCAVCGKMVAPKDQKDHLQTQHLGPHYFWFDGKKHRTMKPSMTIFQLKKLLGSPVLYPVFEEREGGDIARSDSATVDLTQQPHFYSVPPATMWGG